MTEISFFIAAIVVIYFFKDLITILSILSVILVGYMYFTGTTGYLTQ
jgi:hypothetical protein